MKDINEIRTYKEYMEILDSEHILIAGAAGCGKSTLLDALIFSTCFMDESPIIYIVDPKRVDLRRWSVMRNVAKHVTKPEDAIALLRELLDIMEKRYEVMERDYLKKTNERHIYLFIDEVADLLTNKSFCKDTEYLIMRLAALGRAAGIHVVMASQQVKADILNTSITNNFTCRVALRTATAIQSRIIVNESGAERLPEHGYGIVSKGPTIAVKNLPMIPDEEIQAIIESNK